MPNVPKGRFWDADLLVNFCLEAVQYAAGCNASVGIDSWGVDHAFVDQDDKIVFGPVMYRDPTHLAQFDKALKDRHFAFQRTGIAHQPFNTLYQLAARSMEDPSLRHRADWFLIPDLMGLFLTGVRRHERTQASTTQLMGLDGTWNREMFDLAGWPVPRLEPTKCGSVLGHCQGVPIVTVASHDTGSAVVGVGSMLKGEAYLNVGTWALLGVVLDCPNTTPEAEKGNWTNEWAHDDKIRFLKNIPGFFVINRLCQELGSGDSVGDWLERRDQTFLGRFDPHDPRLYNPDSMVEAVSAACTIAPKDSQQFAEAALSSLVECIVTDLRDLEALTGNLSQIRVVGGGSRSRSFCEALARATGMKIVAGHVEATVLGNLALQFVATEDMGPSETENLLQHASYDESVGAA